MILTESFELVETNSALAVSSLDTTRMEDVVTFEQPHFLFVPLKVELHLAVVASVRLVHDTLGEETAEDV